MLTAFLIFLATLVLVIWQPRGLGIGWSAAIGAGVALLAGVIQLSDIPVVWHIVWRNQVGRRKSRPPIGTRKPITKHYRLARVCG